MQAVFGRVIVEVSEMGGRRRADVEAMKAFVKRMDDGSVRLPWHRMAEPLPRRFVMAATTNRSDDLPNDPSGNRRFVPVALPDGSNVEAYMYGNREQLWTETAARWQAGERANLPRDLYKL